MARRAGVSGIHGFGIEAGNGPSVDWRRNHEDAIGRRESMTKYREKALVAASKAQELKTGLKAS
jgi:hypothetical protein